MKHGFLDPLYVRLSQHKLLSVTAGDNDFLDLAASCASHSPSAVLLSGGMPVRYEENRYSIAAWDPFIILNCKGTRCNLRILQLESTFDADPLSLMDEVSACLRPDFPLVSSPFSGGAIGYFAYELKNTIERLPQTACDDLSLPDLLLFWPRKILIHDRLAQELRLLTLTPHDDFPPNDPPMPHPQLNGGSDTPFRIGALRSNFSYEAYLQAVSKIRRYIREGDVYQVNLSQRRRFSFEGDPFLLWSSFFDINPAAFYAYINAGDHQILSTSMERFLYRKEKYLESRPIKGTRKRGENTEDDERLKQDLVTNKKDDAELSMIVDLVRNDLGRICAPTTIHVREHKRLETYQNVHHLVSIVAGELRPEATHGEIIRAAFPGGSITGCPKIRAMEIIDELEPHVRHVYTGAIGYLGWRENMDLNVAIRTGIIYKGTCFFSFGGGIVYDSRGEDEYEETLHKGRTMFQLIEKIEESAL